MDLTVTPDTDSGIIQNCMITSNSGNRTGAFFFPELNSLVLSNWHSATQTGAKPNILKHVATAKYYKYLEDS